MDKKNFIPIIENDDGKGSKVWYISKFLDENYGFDLISIIKQTTPTAERRVTGEEYTNIIRKQVPDNFCLYPFTHFQLDPDGRARPCCKYKVGDPTWQQDVPKLPDVDITELWEQQEFQDLRDKFLKNERPSWCKACWDEEGAGIKSMRLTKENGGKQHPHATFFHHIPNQYPATLDFKLSNLCNLKCRICTPFLSSQWIKEIKDLKIRDMGAVETFTKNSREKFIENPNNIEILKKWAPTVNHLEFYGGEPLMQQEHDSIIEIIYNHGNPSKTSLFYNTNSTIYKERLFEIWKPFQKVIINFSIDDIEQRFEYQRYNAKWSQTLEHIKLYQESAKKHNVNMELRIYVTVGILNVYYLKEFFEKFEVFGIPITLNLVHYPHHYAIINLPNAVKDKIKEKLLTIKNTNIINSYSLKIENIINFMYNTDYKKELLNLFFTKTKQHDDYRKESFKDIFPEFYEILKEYEIT
jgi:molybdenum cofactor biosynthesis enzyme MoaA